MSHCRPAPRRQNAPLKSSTATVVTTLTFDQLIYSRITMFIYNKYSMLQTSQKLTDVGTWTNWLTFERDPNYTLNARTGLLSPISYKRWYMEFYIGENPMYTKYIYWQPATAARRSFKMVLFTEPSEHLCRRYMRSTERPSSLLMIICSLCDLRLVFCKINQNCANSSHLMQAFMTQCKLVLELRLVMMMVVMMVVVMIVY